MGDLCFIVIEVIFLGVIFSLGEMDRSIWKIYGLHLLTRKDTCSQEYRRGESHHQLSVGYLLDHFCKKISYMNIEFALKIELIKKDERWH